MREASHSKRRRSKRSKQAWEHLVAFLAPLSLRRHFGFSPASRRFDQHPEPRRANVLRVRRMTPHLLTPVASSRRHRLALLYSSFLPEPLARARRPRGDFARARQTRALARPIPARPVRASIGRHRASARVESSPDARARAGDACRRFAPAEPPRPRSLTTPKRRKRAREGRSDCRARTKRAMVRSARRGFARCATWTMRRSGWCGTRTCGAVIASARGGSGRRDRYSCFTTRR